LLEGRQVQRVGQQEIVDFVQDEPQLTKADGLPGLPEYAQGDVRSGLKVPLAREP
jgi:hypothetical protein